MVNIVNGEDEIAFTYSSTVAVVVTATCNNYNTFTPSSFNIVYV